MIPLSVLDLAPIIEGGTAAQAFANSLDLAQHAERWGYRRFWLAERHASYSEATWREWVLRQAAAPLPGAAAFTARARALGGRVVIVTTRNDAECDPTRANLRQAGIVADEVLCRTDAKNGSKDPRFEAVAAGTAPSTLGPLKVLMWVGDNIQDFPRLTQSIRTASDSAFADFGETYIALPNPMYGSWERNPLP